MASCIAFALNLSTSSNASSHEGSSVGFLFYDCFFFGWDGFLMIFLGCMFVSVRLYPPKCILVCRVSIKRVDACVWMFPFLLLSLVWLVEELLELVLSLLVVLCVPPG